jgi:hypothetical protein
MAGAIKKKKIKKPQKNAPVLPSVRLYKRVAGVFLSLTLIVLVVVIYLATMNATIYVKTEDESVSREFVARVMTEPQSGEDIPGAIFVSTVERTKTFVADGEGEEVPAYAHGTVVLHNDSSTDQPLVKTTRLLNKDGVLFRITEGVVVPANSTVSVEARADKKGADGNVAAGKYTIPGLNPARQEVVYATSDSEMVGGVEKRSIITLEDLDAAQVDLASEIEKELDTKWRQEISGQLDGVIIKREVLEKRSDTEPGTEAGTFTISTIIRYTGIYYDRARLFSIAEMKLAEHMGNAQVLAGLDKDTTAILYNRHDVTNGTAHFDITANGTAVLKATADILEKENLIGLSAAEAEAFLEGQATIKDATVELKPFWIRRIPKLEDHITIEILGE